MVTIVDALTVTLGLDASGFTKGQAEARLNLKRTSDEATKVAGDMEARGKQAAEFFSQVKTEALGLIGVLLGAGGLTEFVKNTTNSLADLGRAARDIGETSGRLQAFTNIIAANGGTAEGATQSLQNYANAIQRFKEFGAGDIMKWLAPIGGNLSDTPIEAYLKFQKYVEENAGTPGGVQKIIQEGLGLGYDIGTINAALQLRTLTEAVKEFGTALDHVPSDENVAKMTQLQKDFITLRQHIVNLAETTLAANSGPLDQFVKWMTELVDKEPGVAAGLAVVAGYLTVIAGLNFGTLMLLLARLVPVLGMALALKGDSGPDVVPGQPSGWDPTGQNRSLGTIIGDWWRDNMPASLGGGGASPSLLNPREQARLAGIRDQLSTDLGISKEAASGLVSNLYAESGVRGINERGVPEGTGGFGWAQWTGSRRKEFMAYAQAHHLDPASDAANYGFLVEELRTKYPQVLAQLRAGKITAQQAANIVFSGYESGGDPGLEHNRAGHVANADQISRFSGAPAPAAGSTLVPSPAARPSSGLPAAGGAPGAAGAGGAGTSVNIGSIVVNTQATDSRTISRDIGKALSDELVTQGNRGLQ
jgi:Phage tail lysozyme